MKLLILFPLILLQTLVFSQEDKNWRLFPGKDSSAKATANKNLLNNGNKTLNYEKQDGVVTISQPAALDSLTNYHKRNTYILGYTVQLEVSQQTSKIRDARYRLLKLMPNAPIEEIYAAPNTYLYGGAFYTRTDAYAFKHEIRSNFPNAIVISKKLDLPPLQATE